jgi:uncharacterized caspase-like protein
MAKGRQPFRILVLLATCLLLLCIRAAADPAERRIALVIGNDSYAHIASLSKAGNNAHAIAAALKGQGFVVLEGYNLERTPMRQQIHDFIAALPRYDVGVFYYAGHGVQTNGENWLLPVGVPESFRAEADLAGEAVSTARIAADMAAANHHGFNLLIIDANQDNPFGAGNNGIGAPDGLGVRATDGVMLLSSAGAHQTALDSLGENDRDPNSLFTRELLKAMREPGLPVRDMVSELRTKVWESARHVGHAQMAAVYDATTGDFMFTPPAATPPQASHSAPAPAIAPLRSLSVGRHADPNLSCTSLGNCDSSTAAGQPLPDFPWPPPAPSAEMVLPDTIFRKTPATSLSLAAVGEQIVGALRRADYLEYSFYRAPDGFALVARLERMSPDGSSMPSEFRYIPPDATEPFSFTGYLRSLFFAPEGFYRLIAFVVTDRPFVAAAAAMDAAGAQHLLLGGANRLPEQLRAEAFTPAHAVTALIYEYRKGSSTGDVATIVPGRLAAETHLRRARIGLLPGPGP